MKVAIFSTKSYDRQFFTAANSQHQHQLIFLEPKLDRHTAILAKDATAVCIFVNDEVDRSTLEVLANDRVSLIALRSAGYNNVDVATAKNLGIKLVRVPAYSPYAVAEHTVGLILTLNRKLHRHITASAKAIFHSKDCSDLIYMDARSGLSVQAELAQSLPKS
jgi:D-lactate dehydrogenase